jgi:hypothetical protein
MTSPYSSALLNEPPVAAHAVPRPHVAPRPVYAAPAPQYAPPSPQYVIAAPARTSSGAVIGLVALVLILLAGAAAYLMTANNGPTAEQVAAYQMQAANSGFFAGREAGNAAGRQAAIQRGQQIAALKGEIARQKAYANGYQHGKRAGQSSYRPPSSYTPRYYGGPSYYRPRCYYGCGGGGGSELHQALSEAQNLANETGAPVDVTVSN